MKKKYVLSTRLFKAFPKYNRGVIFVASKGPEAKWAETMQEFLNLDSLSHLTCLAHLPVLTDSCHDHT